MGSAAPEMTGKDLNQRNASYLKSEYTILLEYGNWSLREELDAARVISRVCQK